MTDFTLKMKNKVLILNHVFWPDKHNTARHISELAEELQQREWKVSALITNRSYTNKNQVFSPRKGEWNGVKYNRIRIPRLSQKKNIPRLLTALIITINWIFRSPTFKSYDAIIIGTNPPFSYFALPFIRLFNRKSKIFLWGFDLYPEAIIVTGGILWKVLGKIVKPFARYCYKQIDVIVDIGACMKRIYKSYVPNIKTRTLPPWSFIEPSAIESPDNKTRKDLFGSAKVTLLYSGTIGNAHEFDNFLSLARELNRRNSSVSFCFAGFGNGFEKLKNQVHENDTNISFGGFVETDEELELRLSSPDLMLISLKNEWTGISVPSKYFGALASGKCVLFSGSSESALSIWTKKYNVGYHLNQENINEVANFLDGLTKNPNVITEMQTKAFNIYREKFSKKAICDGWSELLTNTINEN